MGALPRDSDGKSGGQKEKLAYTILAASLAYQFGLEWGVEKSRDFRFAVIDEAFGRGSDVSTRYALDLFARLPRLPCKRSHQTGVLPVRSGVSGGIAGSSSLALWIDRRSWHRR